MEKINYYLPPVPTLAETILPISDEEINTFKPIAPYTNNKIAVIIVHFLRDKLLFNTLTSIFKNSPGVKIYIADQGVYNSNLEKLYNKLIESGHEVIYAGYDAGISRCRNLLVKATTEPYIYWQDDDVLFLVSTNLSKAIKILDNNNDIGIVGFQEFTKDKINHYEMHLDIKDRMIFYKPAWDEELNENKQFNYCDMVINDAIAKREIFNDVLWDEDLKLAEHLDFFLQVKYNSKWKVVYTDIYVKHQDMIITDENYKLFRGRNKYFWQYYSRKWNVDYIHNLEFKSNAPWKIPLFTTSIKEESLENNNTQSIELPVTSIKSVEETKVSTSIIDVEAELKRFVEILENAKYQYCILHTTCSEMVCDGKIQSSPLFISIPKFDERLISILKQREYIYENNICIRNNVIIKISSEKLVVKNYQFKKKVYIVPCPVVDYLKRLQLWHV